MWTSADTLAQATTDGRYLIWPCPRCGRVNGCIVAHKGDTPPDDAFRCKFKLTPNGEAFNLCADEWDSLRAILKGA